MENIKIIDFFATWCAPCRMMEQNLNKVEERFKNVTLVKIDIDKYPELKTNYEVTSLPTLLFKNSKGEIVDRKIGVISEKDINDTIRKIIESEKEVTDND